MMLYVDASALVAVLLGEPDRDAILDELEQSREPITSCVSVWETAAAMHRGLKSSVDAYAQVQRFLDEVGISIIPIGMTETRAAFEAFRLYGKGSGHRARLNMGDCFSYGCALVHARRMLFVGDDFEPHTARPDADLMVDWLDDLHLDALDHRRPLPAGGSP